MTMPLGEGLVPAPRDSYEGVSPVIAQLALQRQLRNMVLIEGARAAEQHIHGGVAIEDNPDFVAARRAYARAEANTDRLAIGADTPSSEDLIA
jgi:hypothetical protein